MGTAARVVGMFVFALFVSVLALRPLVANPAISGAIRDGLDGPGLLLVAPLVLVTVLVVALRLRSLTGGEPDHHEEQYSVAGSGESFWEDRKSSAGTGDDADVDDSLTADTGEGGGERGVTAASPQASESASELPAEIPDILRGQGGTREKDFEIEEKPPDAMLSEHLEHLQAQFDDDETVARDLETLEEVAREVEERSIPERCPRDHCDAVWTGRTVLGIGTERYDVLEDGKRVQCLECEEIHTLE